MNSADAYICSYECTWCGSCTKAMHHTCPNCGGELVKRPRRAKEGLIHDPTTDFLRLGLREEGRLFPRRGRRRMGLRRRHHRLRLFHHVDLQGSGGAGPSDLPQYRRGSGNRPAPASPMWCGPITSCPGSRTGRRSRRSSGNISAKSGPASTAIIAGLVDPRMRIEIEVTARRRAKERRGHSPRRKRG